MPLLIVALLSLLDATPVVACECVRLGFCDVVEQPGTVVFVGRAQRFGNTRWVELTVEEWLRGEPIGKTLMVTAFSNCDYIFEDGEPYLVYATRRDDGTWEVSLCGRTRPLKAATEEVALLRAARAKQDHGWVAGAVYAEGFEGDVIRSSRPLSRARLQLRNMWRTRSAVTNAHGEFWFLVAPGPFTLMLDDRPDLRLMTPKRVDVGAAGCTRQDFLVRER